jgi:uncharacterized protein (TIGR04222 family)
VVAATESTWGISESVFVVGYLAILVFVTIRYLTKRQRAVDFAKLGPTVPPVDPHSLHPIDLAYVRGGADHAMFVALLGLFRRGILRLPLPDAPNPYDLQALRQLPVSFADGGQVAHPLEDALVNGLRQGRPRRETIMSVGRSPAMTAVRANLVTRGLLVAEEQRAAVYRASLWFLPLCGVASVRLMADAMNDQPIDGPVVLALLTAGLALVTPSLARSVPQGRSVVGNLRASSPEDPEPPTSPDLWQVGNDPELVWRTYPVLAAALGFLTPAEKDAAAAAATTIAIMNINRIGD